MRANVPRLLGLALFLLCAVLRAEPADWTTPQKPFHIAGDLYYVGSRDLAAYLITTPKGNILINQNLDSSPPLIRRSVEELGFKWADTRILLNGQGHFDHVAGTAEIAKQTGAKVMVMQYDAELMERGGRGDFSGEVKPYPPVHVDRVLHDGETVELGGVVLTAHRTGGHTRGCTTWTMNVREAGRALHVVIVGGVSALDDYRLVAKAGKPASYPGIAQDFTHTFQALHSLPCDVFLGAHGVYFDMQHKLARQSQEGERVWIDPNGYAAFVGEAQRAFQALLRQQSSQ